MPNRSTAQNEAHRHDFLQKLEEKKTHEPPPVREATSSSSMSHSPLANYLASPIRTLCESVKDPEQDFISDHDIVEAYNVLCGRIRSRKNDISNITTPGPLSSFEEDVPLLVLCISRDIQRVLPNPFESIPRQSYDTDYSINEENIPPATDNLLCQNALRLMSDLLMYPALYSVFSQDHISTLFQDALLLCMPNVSRAFDIERLRCTVLLMLKTQQLPLNLFRHNLTSVLNALLCITNTQEATMSKIDGLTVISSLLQKYPTLLLHFVSLLPSILENLKIIDLEVRLAAVHTLSAFALAKLNSLDAPLSSPIYNQVAEAIHIYITKEHSKSLPPDDSLPLVVKSAISDDPRSFWKKKGPSFAIAFVSALGILLDYRIFTSPRSLKLVFSVIQASAGTRWKHVAVHSEVWKLLLWAFSRIPRDIEDLKDPMADGQDLESWNDTRERAYRLLKQDVRDGIGSTFVTTLLHSGTGGPRDKEDVGKALEIVEDLMKGGGRTEGDAVMLLEKLMSGIGAPLHGSEEERRLGVRFSKELVDGSIVGKAFRDITIRPATTPIGDIQPLSEAEALSFWDKLAEIWSSVVHHFLVHSDDNLPRNLFETWQALLLVQGQLTGSHQHLTASPSFTSRVVSIVTQISSPLETPQAQARYLNTILELWTVMKNVFTTTWLPSPAERVLASLLKKRFDLSNETVKIYWSRLCAELISVGIPTLLHVLHLKASNPSEEEMEVTRRLWAVLAKSAGTGDKDVQGDDWMNLVQLLVMPFGAWTMVDSEVDIWRTTLARTVDAGASVFQPSQVVISVVLDTLGESKLDLVKSMPNVLDALLSCLITSPCTETTLKVLSMIDSALQTSYPGTPECKNWALGCLRLTAKLISQAVDTEVLQIISVMQHGLCKWIADEDSVFTESEHQKLMTTIYGEALRRLGTVEPSLDRLRVLANFLYSAFVRVRNDGLLSFQKFWRSTYHRHYGISKKEYPLAIRTCLKAWSDVCDDSFADDISLGSDSQSLESYTIPDSQPSPEKGKDASNWPINETGKGILEGSGDESSQGTVTPNAKQSSILSEVLPAVNQTFTTKNPPSELKRQSDLDVPQTPKRRRIGPHFSSPFLGQPSTSKALANNCQSPNLSSLSPPALNSRSLMQERPPKRPREETASWLGSDLKRQRGPDASSDYDRDI